MPASTRTRLATSTTRQSTSTIKVDNVDRTSTNVNESIDQSIKWRSTMYNSTNSKRRCRTIDELQKRTRYNDKSTGRLVTRSWTRRTSMNFNRQNWFNVNHWHRMSNSMQRSTTRPIDNQRSSTQRSTKSDPKSIDNDGTMIDDGTSGMELNQNSTCNQM